MEEEGTPGRGWHRQSRRHAEAALKGLRMKASKAGGSIRRGLGTRRGKVLAAATAAGAISVVVIKRKRRGDLEANAAFATPDLAKAFADKLREDGIKARVFGSNVVATLKTKYGEELQRIS